MIKMKVSDHVCGLWIIVTVTVLDKGLKLFT